MLPSSSVQSSSCEFQGCESDDLDRLEHSEADITIDHLHHDPGAAGDLLGHTSSGTKHLAVPQPEYGKGNQEGVRVLLDGGGGEEEGGLDPLCRGI